MTEPEKIEDELREPRFAKRVWGYDIQQVDAFLAATVERLGEDGLGGAAAVPGLSELSGVGEKVEEILVAARAAAEQVQSSTSEQVAALRRDSEEAAEQLRREAEDYAEKTRRSADEYEASTHAEAEQEAADLRERAGSEAEAKVAAADEEAEQLLRDARLELGRIEDAVEDLRERRQLVVTSIERLRGSLGSMVGEAAQGTTELAALNPEQAANLEQETAAISQGDEFADSELDAGGDAGSDDAEMTAVLEEGRSDDGRASDPDLDEYETGEWGAIGDEEGAIESDSDQFHFADVNADTDEQRVRGEDL